MFQDVEAPYVITIKKIYKIKLQPRYKVNKADKFGVEESLLHYIRPQENKMCC